MLIVDRWLDDTLRREGWPTFTNRLADKGGPTKGGITLTLLRRWRRKATVEDLKNLSEADARDIYRNEFWQPWTWVLSVELHTLLADIAVTSGHRRAVLLLQKALGVDQDGKAGPVTRRAVLDADPRVLYGQVWAERLRFLVGIPFNEGSVREFMRAHPTTQLHNLRGWVNRALELAPVSHLAGGGRDALDSS